ncbi:sugar kinase, ribokinase [Thermoplasmatales archaeon SCGC AB-539-N05]|nr:sugar kinase, ribokinase [Thermoplasmatales archaeon SCGC AB-539-N05]
MDLLVVGNMAYDTICNVKFLPEKNQATLIDDLDVTPYFGGCAGNVAVIAGGLGIKTGIFSIVDKNFRNSKYLKQLKKYNIDITHLYYSKTSIAHSFVFTNPNEDQQIFYYPGASSELNKYTFDFKDYDYVHFAAGEISVYHKFMKKAVKNGCIVSFDPGQELFHRPFKEQILSCFPYVSYLFLNHHEACFLLKSIKKSNIEDLFFEKTDAIIVSNGEKGCTIHSKDQIIKIPAVRPSKLMDPTGAGDAHRAGFLVGLIRGYGLEQSGKIASATSSFVIEEKGAQTAVPSWNMIKGRMCELSESTLL